MLHYACSMPICPWRKIRDTCSTAQATQSTPSCKFRYKGFAMHALTSIDFSNTCSSTHALPRSPRNTCAVRHILPWMLHHACLLYAEIKWFSQQESSQIFPPFVFLASMKWVYFKIESIHFLLRLCACTMLYNSLVPIIHVANGWPTKNGYWLIWPTVTS